MSESDVLIREARPSDAEALLEVMKQANTETRFLLLDENFFDMTPEIEALQLEQIQESRNNLLLLAFLGEKIIGCARISGEAQQGIQHIGEVGVFVLKEFWHQGLGTALLEEVIHWAQHSKIMRRLFLTVQSRNENAISLYRKYHFQVEGIQSRGYWDEEAGFCDVIMMSLLIN